MDRAAIAQIMGISEQSVSNLFQEAFRFIRRQVTSDQFWLLWLLLLSN
jgi:DNA-directed RNA polymerase specialized sigma24 family protein